MGNKKIKTKNIVFDKKINFASNLAQKILNLSYRDSDIFQLFRNPYTYEVIVKSDLKLIDYRRTTRLSDWMLLKKMAESMKGKSVVFINPTMEGGGVAMLRPPIVHLFRLMGIDAHWFVMNSNDVDGKSPFLFTKQMHNILQRRLDPSNRIDAEGKRVHYNWNLDNASVLTEQSIIRSADIIVLDDPQPAPLKKMIEKVNTHAKWVWRSHIDTSNSLMSDSTTPQAEVASYLLDDCDIRTVDAVIAHPVDEFIYPGMYEKTYFAPATVELRDDLNCRLSDTEKTNGIKFINDEISKKNEDFIAAGRLDDFQEKIDMHRRQIVLIARFDESKGMDKAMAIGSMVRSKMRDAGYDDSDLPQVILVGNGSVDDPSGEFMYEKMLQIRRERFFNEKKDIIIMRLKHNYKAMNALMSYAPGNKERKSSQVVALQMSEAEGCETRVSDWIFHGIPVVVSNRGGISLQIIENKSGLVLDFDKPDSDLERGANFIFELMTQQFKYDAIVKSTKKAASNFNKREFVTTANATRLLRVFSSVLSGKKADKVWRISDMTKNADRLYENSKPIEMKIIAAQLFRQ